MFPAALSLLGAIVYGSADFFGGLAAHRLRAIVVAAVSAGSGLLALILALPLLGGRWLPADIAWGALSGIAGVVAIVLLYACLAVGPMSILSPLTAVVSAIAPMLWGLLVQGDRLSVFGWVGLGVALVAVVLVGFVPGEGAVRPTSRGLVMAVGAGVAIGVFLILIDQTSAESGLVPLVLNRTVNLLMTGLIVVALAVSATRRGRGAASELRTPDASDPPSARAWWLAVICGVLDASANAILLFALRLGELTIVSALTALYPAGTILLAALVLKERVASVQWVGLALALAAGGMLALA
ncbi:EamA family transporter [Microbacterium pygmaeum]|uniref:EamA-like transporter family protein n=1 Tax=Microbacterium pygmaeum TaxID=370764 RepID=A0A1G7Y5V1_9MICO|nr:EamA family transporter [Microbacterium pygmaeum]SDG91842.1 EamA-like transporter family protein [Microbacterium pygmaeum]